MREECFSHDLHHAQDKLDLGSFFGSSRHTCNTVLKGVLSMDEGRSQGMLNAQPWSNLMLTVRIPLSHIVPLKIYRGYMGLVILG